jgi:hypothetical protein
LRTALPKNAMAVARLEPLIIDHFIQLSRRLPQQPNPSSSLPDERRLSTEADNIECGHSRIRMHTDIPKVHIVKTLRNHCACNDPKNGNMRSRNGAGPMRRNENPWPSRPHTMMGCEYGFGNAGLSLQTYMRNVQKMGLAARGCGKGGDGEGRCWPTLPCSHISLSGRRQWASQWCTAGQAVQTVCPSESLQQRVGGWGGAVAVKAVHAAFGTNRTSRLPNIAYIPNRFSDNICARQTALVCNSTCPRL